MSRFQDRFDFDPPFGGASGTAVRAGPITIGFGQEATTAVALQSSGRSVVPMVGALGVEPIVRQIATRKCPRTYVLAIDGLCYPKKMVPKIFRVWPADVKPPVTRADAKAIRRAALTQGRLIKLTKDAGAHASKNKPRPRQKLLTGSCD